MQLMRQFVYLTMVLLLLNSCGMSSEDKAEMNNLKAQNEVLNIQVNKLQDENKELKQSYSKYVKDNPGPDIRELLVDMSTKYIVIEITYKIAYPDNSLADVRSKYVSGIIKSVGWSDDIKYQLLDQQQQSLESKINHRVRAISRDAHMFNSYADASKYLEKLSTQN